MAKLTHVLPGTPGDHNGNDKGGEDHRNTQWPPDHTPANIFKKPEYNVEVFHLSVAEGNVIRLLVWHVSQVLLVTQITGIVEKEKHELLKRITRIVLYPTPSPLGEGWGEANKKHELIRKLIRVIRS